ncbi:RICIN domain-containing protein [Mycobacterium sp.]|uniref:Rv1419 family lectin n=1 Tax=Mycobacterium sp. TaxID=1785 RepID=UPI002CF4D0CF|nr:RICIN domain-containing protein [Mycobacterium sp.]HTQ22367.1 RICIN domain-containing protein [Mycobacterium sp.]
MGAALGVTVLGAGEASADGPVQLRTRLGDVCLDAPSDSWLTPVVINPCNGANNQRWNVTGDGRLENAAFPGKCITPQEDNWTVRLVACWNSQRWTIQPDGRITAYMGPCLTVRGGPAPGTLVSTRFCNGSPEQGWDSVP